jgi:hypothetical protein
MVTVEPKGANGGLDPPQLCAINPTTRVKTIRHGNKAKPKRGLFIILFLLLPYNSWCYEN